MVQSVVVWHLVHPSRTLDVAIDHALLAGLVELDHELVAVDRGHVAVAEFLVEHAIADREGGDGAGRFGDQLALDSERRDAAVWSAAEAARAEGAPSLSLPRKR